MTTRLFFERGETCVWIEKDGPSLRLHGQDLGGVGGTPEYEYFITILSTEFDKIREVLDAPDDADILDVMCANADEIYSRGETDWLTLLDIDYKFRSWSSLD